MVDVGLAAQRAAEERLTAIAEAEELMDEGVEVVDHPACGPFCGCETCVVREVLDAAWPVLLGGMVDVLLQRGCVTAAQLLLAEYAP